jgi:hypothetical protein
MQVINLCGYTASFSLSGEHWGPLRADAYYAVVGRFSIVGLRPTTELTHPHLGPCTSSALDFPAPAEGVIYLTTPEVAIALERSDVIGVRRYSPPRVAPVVVDQE